MLQRTKHNSIALISSLYQNFTTPVGGPPPTPTQALSIKDHRTPFLTSLERSRVNVPVATAKAK
tara:strand:+ start:100 stop:291 length:192 start_codon:yes stop_codon:yes gene_type:complete